jgi:PAS domain S-box-containing protein
LTETLEFEARLRAQERALAREKLTRQHVKGLLAAQNASDLLQRSHLMLNTIASAQFQYILDQDCFSTFNELTLTILEITESEFGFIGEIYYHKDGTPYLKARSLSSLSLSKEFHNFLEGMEPSGLEFHKLEDLLDYTVRTGKALVLNDLHDASFPLSEIKLANLLLKTYCGIPIYAGQQLVGIVSIANRAQGYQEEDIIFLQPLLRTIGNLIRANRAEISRHQAETSLKQNEELLQLFITNAPAPVAMMDTEMNYLMASHRWIEEYHPTIGMNIIGKKWTELNLDMPEEQKQKIALVFKECLNGHVWERQESKYLRKNGCEEWVVWEMRPWYRSVGTPGGILIFCETITEKKTAEEKIRKMVKELQRSNAELEKFAYICSHDLKEPLRAISSFSGLIKSQNPLMDESSKQYLNHIISSTHRMNELIHGILRYATLEATKLKWELVSLPALMEVIQQSLSVLIKEKKAIIETNLCSSFIMGDETRLQQLFQNLIANALKFNDSPQARVMIEMKEGIKEWYFSIQDNGIGIEEEYYESIFTLFHKLNPTHDYKGTGIGLSVCQKIVEQHGGKISVSSVVGEGSTFYFTLAKEVPER